MIHQQNILRFISRGVISLLMLFTQQTASAQGFLKMERDTVPFFQGFAVSADLVGVAQMMLSDYGQYEGAFRLNLHNQYFPVVEVGYGKANHEEDDVTGISYRTEAPYFRFGVDVNIMKKKHTGNRIFAGVRYAYTNYKVNISQRAFVDPAWQWETSFDVKDMRLYQHWAEALFGIDAKIAGPLHLGWSVRYRMRLAHNDNQIGQAWYVPGFGLQDSGNLGGTFNVIIDI